MTEKPFVHKKAYANVKSNFIYQEDAAKLFLKLLIKKELLMLAVQVKQFINLQKKKIKKYKKNFLKR